MVQVIAGRKYKEFQAKMHKRRRSTIGISTFRMPVAGLGLVRRKWLSFPRPSRRHVCSLVRSNRSANQLFSFLTTLHYCKTPPDQVDVARYTHLFYVLSPRQYTSGTLASTFFAGFLDEDSIFNVQRINFQKFNAHHLPIRALFGWLKRADLKVRSRSLAAEVSACIFAETLLGYNSTSFCLPFSSWRLPVPSIEYHILDT